MNMMKYKMLPRRGLARRLPAKLADMVASQVARGLDLLLARPTSFLTASAARR